jgi:hypothetical protein
MGQMANKNIRASSVGDLRAHPVAPLTDGTRAFINEGGGNVSIFYLDKTSGAVDNGTTILEPLAGDPIAGAADARWIICACARL